MNGYTPVGNLYRLYMAVASTATWGTFESRTAQALVSELRRQDFPALSHDQVQRLGQAFIASLTWSGFDVQHWGRVQTAMAEFNAGLGLT